MIVRRLRYSILLALLCAGSALAQPEIDFNGYVKYLFSSASVPKFDERFDDHLIHARLNTQWYLTGELKAEADIRMRAFYGDTKEHFDGYYEMIRSRHPFAQLDWNMWESPSSLGYAQIDRLWIDYTGGALQATAGRQRIAWGTAFAWNIIDVFNPKDVLDFDYEELPGADALRVQYYTGPVSKIEAAYNPGTTWSGTTLGGLWSLNEWDYDFYLIGGLRRNAWFTGGAWAGDIADGGFRGEALISQSPEKFVDKEKTLKYGSPFYNLPHPVVSAVISGDYSFENSLTLTAEAMYNSAGVIEHAALYSADALAAGMLSPSRWSVYLSASYQPHPLVQASAFTIINPIDGSLLASPQATWSVVTNLDVSALAFLTTGGALTEFGEYGDYYYIRAKWAF